MSVTTFHRMWPYAFLSVVRLLIIATVLLFLIVPLLSMLPMSLTSGRYLSFPPRGLSLRWYRQFFGSYEWISALLRSSRIAAFSSLIAVGLAIPAARGAAVLPPRWARFVHIVFALPLVIPLIVLAVGLYMFFARFNLVATELGLVLAYSIICFPLVFFPVRGILANIDPRMERAAMTLGARPYRAFLRVTFPQILPAVIAGALFAFAYSFDELVIALFLCGPDTTTLPKRMWEGLRFEATPAIAVVSCVLVLITVFSFVVAGILSYKFSGRRFVKHA